MNQAPLIIMICAIPFHLVSVRVFSASLEDEILSTAIAYDVTYFTAFICILLYTTLVSKSEEILKCREGFQIQKDLFFESSVTSLIWSLTDYASVFSLIFLSGASSIKDQAASLISYCVF